MNLLVRLFLEKPWLIDGLGDGEIVRFHELVERIPSDSQAGRLARAIADDPFTREQLATYAYLQVLTAPAWEEALTLASSHGSLDAAEWVTMVAASSGQTGLTLPQDSSPVERFSLFRLDDGGGARRMSIDVVRNSPVSFSVGVSSGHHCNLPSRGICGPGACGGCARFKRAAEPAGIVCVCSHNR